MPLLLKNPLSTSRKNIDQDHHQLNTVGDKQTDGETKRRQGIEKQNSVSSTTSSTHTLVTLSEEFNNDMEEIKAVRKTC